MLVSLGPPFGSQLCLLIPSSLTHSAVVVVHISVLRQDQGACACCHLGVAAEQHGCVSPRFSLPLSASSPLCVLTAMRRSFSLSFCRRCRGVLLHTRVRVQGAGGHRWPGGRHLSGWSCRWPQEVNHSAHSHECGEWHMMKLEQMELECSARCVGCPVIDCQVSMQLIVFNT